MCGILNFVLEQRLEKWYDTCSVCGSDVLSLLCLDETDDVSPVEKGEYHSTKDEASKDSSSPAS